MPSTKRRVLVGSVLVALVVVATLAWRYGRSASVVPPADNAFAGLTREQIVARLGTPDGQWPGHYGNPSLEWAMQYDPCETLTYLEWNGTLYISVYQKNGQWVCFSSTWLPEGAAF